MKSNDWRTQFPLWRYWMVHPLMTLVIFLGLSPLIRRAESWSTVDFIIERLYRASKYVVLYTTAWDFKIRNVSFRRFPIVLGHTRAKITTKSLAISLLPCAVHSLYDTFKYSFKNYAEAFHFELMLALGRIYKIDSVTNCVYQESMMRSSNASFQYYTPTIIFPAKLRLVPEVFSSKNRYMPCESDFPAVYKFRLASERTEINIWRIRNKRLR